MTVLRRLDAVLENSKEELLDMKKRLDDAGVIEQDQALRQAAGQAFYNTSKFTLRELMSRAERNCTGRAEQNYATERRGVRVKVLW